MKRKKGGMPLYILGAVVLCAAIVPLIAFFGLMSAEEKTIPWLLVVGIIGTVVGIVLLIVGGKLLNQLDEESEKQMQEYMAYPFRQITDYKKELEITRKNFHADTDPKKNLPKMRRFINASNCYDYSVIQNGEIYYAQLVQANMGLFKKNFSGLAGGAVVLYSQDEYYASNPLALQEVAYKLYANKNSNILRQESNFFTNLMVPKSLTEGREVYITSMMLYRLHLPTGYLSDSLFPIIANPQQSTTALVADVKYWSPDLIGNFVNHGSTYDWEETEESLDNME